MIVTRQSQLTGQLNTLTLPLSEEEFNICSQRYQKGAFIQNAFPMLNCDQREFLLTGITPDEWDNLLGPEPEE